MVNELLSQPQSSTAAMLIGGTIQLLIVVSVLYFRNPLTLMGASGSAVAILGVLLYSLAKAQSGGGAKRAKGG